MLHLIKLAVGASSVENLRARQAEHAASFPPLNHRTRQFPRRASEVLDGGSLYWVIDGLLIVRQAVTDIVPGVRADGRACTEFRLDTTLISVAPRRVKAFQGWRYLEADQVPADMTSDAIGSGLLRLPEELRKELASLCLI